MSDAKPVVVVTGCSKGGIGFALYVHAVSCLPRPLASHVQNRGSADAFATKGCIIYATARRIDAMEGLEHDNVRMLAEGLERDGVVDLAGRLARVVQRDEVCRRQRLLRDRIGVIMLSSAEFSPQ